MWFMKFLKRREQKESKFIADAPTPVETDITGERTNAVERQYEDTREWIYMGDGMMEEVIRKKPKEPTEDEIERARWAQRHMAEAHARNVVQRQSNSSVSRTTSSDNLMVYTAAASYVASDSPTTSCDTSTSFGGTCD